MNESAEPRQVKILFSFHSNLLDKRVVETLWATVVDVDAGHYKIENIPFYVTGVAFGDIVSAKYDAEEESLVFADVVEPSGNSTLQIFMMVENIDKQTIRDELSAMGVDTESFDDRFFVADISGSLDYRPVKAYLDRQQQDGVLDYAESCLSAVHYYE